MYTYLIKGNEVVLVTEKEFDRSVTQETFPAKEDRENTHAILSYSEELGVYWNYIPFAPSEMREQAYRTEKLIPWNDGLLTVDEGNDMWLKYDAEGSAKAAELTALISEAKEEIRARYPEENAGIE